MDADLSRRVLKECLSVYPRTVFVIAKLRYHRYIEYTISLRRATFLKIKRKGRATDGVTHVVMSDMAYVRIDWSPGLYVAAASRSMGRE